MRAGKIQRLLYARTENRHLHIGKRRGSYGSPGSGPNSGGGLRCPVAASKAEAMRNSVASSNGRAMKSTPTGKLALMGPTKRVPPLASLTRSQISVVKPAGTVIAG